MWKSWDDKHYPKATLFYTVLWGKLNEFKLACIGHTWLIGSSAQEWKPKIMV